MAAGAGGRVWLLPISVPSAIAEAARQRLLAEATDFPAGRNSGLLTALKRASPARAREIETLLAAPAAPTFSLACAPVPATSAGVVLDRGCGARQGNRQRGGVSCAILAAPAGSCNPTDRIAASTAEKAGAGLLRHLETDPRLNEPTQREAGKGVVAQHPRACGVARQRQLSAQSAQGFGVALGLYWPDEGGTLRFCAAGGADRARAGTAA